MHILPLYFETAANLPAWLVIILFVVPFGGGLMLFAYKTKHARSWRKGIFPQKLKPTEDNFLEAYLALGAKLILLDYQEMKGRTQYINAYFHRYFTKANYNFGDSLLFSLQHPIQTETITGWMKTHLTEEGQRSQIVYFLTGLAMVKGELNRRELQFLGQINRDLGLDESNLRQILAIYEAYKAHGEKAAKEKSQGKITKKHSCEILGVPENATLQEIKSAYRKLAKIHHPDVFSTGTESQQKMAAEKFAEIHNAYEDLLNNSQ